MRLLHFKKTLGPNILCLKSMPKLLALLLFQHKGDPLTQDPRAFRTSAPCHAVTTYQQTEHECNKTLGLWNAMGVFKNKFYRENRL